MLDFILKYWVQFLCGIIASGLALASKKLYSLYKKDSVQVRKEEHDELYNKLETLITTNNQEIKKENEEQWKAISAIKDGVLSIQGKKFKEECRELLRPDREVTLEEYLDLQIEHNTYNALGGNHDGDSLFAMVEEKVKHLLT